jgi:ligand-binding sensor domain-containing protein/DNA-binding CsgD family transcriptional regulator
MNKYCAYLLLLLLPLAALNAQEVPRIVSFNKNQYGAYNQNWGITQTREGLMYFANAAGLLEFDGENWRTYPLPDKQVLRSVATDGKGKIFGGGYGEFGYWEADRRGELQYHSLRDLLERKEADSEEIWNIVVDSQLVLFQSFSEVYAYDYEKVYMLDDPGLLLFIRKIGRQWIFPIIQDQLYAWQPGREFTPIAGTESLIGQRVKAMVPRKEGGFWVATEIAGFYLFDEAGNFSRWPTEIDQQLGAYQINRVILLRNGYLAVGTILNGLYIIDQQGKLRAHISKESGLQNNTILGLHEDQTGNLWLALDKGIDLILTSQALNFYHDVSGKLGTVYTAQVMNGLLYIGTNQGLYVKDYDRSDQDFTLIEGTQGQVWDLFIYDDRLWCSHNNGTFLVQGRQINWLFTTTGVWRTGTVPGRQDLLLQSTYTGFIVLEKADDTWHYRNKISGLQKPIKNFFFDQEGYVWALHGTRGLWRLQFNPELDSITTLLDIDQSDGLPSTFGMSLTRMDGRLIVGSNNSFFEWNTITQHLEPLDSFHGQALEGQRLRLMAGRGQEWFLSEDKRLHWFRGDSLLADFPVQMVPNFEKIIGLDSTTYLFCLDDGYATLNTSDMETEQKDISKIEPLISKIEVVRPKRRLYYPFRADEQLNTTLEFAPAERQIRFHYALPYYGEATLYRHRILGFEEEFSEWSPTATAEITSLGAGDYVFELQANHSTTTVRLPFQVLPHWYETVFARIFYVMLALLVALLIWRWHRSRLRKHLEELAREKEKQLQEERIRSRNEKLQEDILRKSQELANSTFNLVRKNEILIQLKETLAHNPRADHRQLIRLIDRHLSDEEDWQMFETNFNQVHEVFFKKLKQTYPDLTPGDLRLAAYLRMNLSSKEIAPLLNISLRGVENKRYRLRRKIELDNEENLTDFLMQY